MGKSIKEALGHRKPEAEAKEELQYADGHEKDCSPLLNALSIKTDHPKGGQLQTTIVANVHTKDGFTSKRFVVPGGITVNRLSGLLAGVLNW